MNNKPKSFNNPRNSDNVETIKLKKGKKYKLLIGAGSNNGKDEVEEDDELCTCCASPANGLTSAPILIGAGKGAAPGSAPS